MRISRAYDRRRERFYKDYDDVKDDEFSWSSYWSPTSAVVDKDTPKYVVLTYLHPIRSEYADNLLFSIDGKAIKTATLDESGKILVLGVSIEFSAYDEIYVIANNVSIPVWNRIYGYLLDATIITLGDSSGVSALSMSVSEEVTVLLDSVYPARFYSDVSATENESTTWKITPGAIRTIYIKCPNSIEDEESPLLFLNISKIIDFGSVDYDGYVSADDNSPALVFSSDFYQLQIQQLRCSGFVGIESSFPETLKYIKLEGGVSLSYDGELPAGLLFLYLEGTNIHWSYVGSLPEDLQYLYLNGQYIVWEAYDVILPANLQCLVLREGDLIWTNAGALPNGLTIIYVDNPNVDWTGLNVGGAGNITVLALLKFRSNYKMTSNEMVSLLTQLTNREGTLPSTIVINDYLDYASPPSGVVDAVNALKIAKSVTTVTLGG